MTRLIYPEGFFVTTLSSDINASTSTIPLTAVPSRITTGYMVIEKDSATKREVIYFTSVGVSSVTTADDPTDGSDATGRGCLGSVTTGANTTHSQGSSVIIASVEQYWKRIHDKLTGVDTTAIEDANGNEILKTSTTASAVNEVTVANAATGNAPTISATGGDTNIDLKLAPKGTGALSVAGTTDYETNVTADDDIPNKKYVADGTVTLTNKRITKRITTITSHATPTINTDNCDAVTITAQGEAITSMTTNLSGTPTNFQSLVIRIKDDGTARAITWGASFASRGATLPTTTTLSKVTMVGLFYNSVTSTWDCHAVTTEA